ncbi:MAG: Fe-S cluster assembly protein SufD [Chloroflexi bacterium]|nr:Fe-S cluster assembly protein SufD [Chloroflexota bacterium]
MTQQVEKREKYDQYLADFETFKKSANGHTWLNEIRTTGLSTFNATGFPTATRGNEEWRFTNVGPIARKAFTYPFKVSADSVTKEQLKAIAPWDDKWTTLVFVDGRFDENLSSPAIQKNGVTVSNLDAALDSEKGLIEQHLGRYVESDKNGFTAVNTAFLRDGALVKIADNTEDTPPVHLLFVSSERSEPFVAYPRSLVVVGKNSKATLMESYISLTENGYFTDGVAEIVLQDGAQVDHFRLMREAAQAYHITTTQVHQSKDSTFNSTSFARGSSIARNQIHVALDGPGAACTLKGLYLTDGSEHIDNNINIDHLKPHTNSDLFFKGILAGKSKAVFSGRVIVHKDAQKVLANQSDKNLILSENARINTKPMLLIYADDVKCAHGATAGAVSDDVIFYMLSRGLDMETATRYLIQGFAHEVIDGIPLDGFRDYMDTYFVESLPAYTFQMKRPGRN